MQRRIHYFVSLKGDEMPEPSRNDAPLRNPQYPQGAEREEFPPGRRDFQQPHSIGSNLPSGDIYGQLPRTAAENFGRTIGSAVGGVLRFPLRVGQTSSRLRVAGNVRRAQASAAVLDMMDTAAQRAENLRRTTTETLSDWARSTRYKTAQLEDQAAERWDELRSAAKERLQVVGRRAVAQWDETQRAASQMKNEDPARFLMVVAGAAFVIGAGLRIWRSSSND
jgi:hypothetical protein